MSRSPRTRRHDGRPRNSEHAHGPRRRRITASATAGALEHEAPAAGGSDIIVPTLGPGATSSSVAPAAQEAVASPAEPAPQFAPAASKPPSRPAPAPAQPTRTRSAADEDQPTGWLVNDLAAAFQEPAGGSPIPAALFEEPLLRRRSESACAARGNSWIAYPASSCAALGARSTSTCGSHSSHDGRYQLRLPRSFIIDGSTTEGGTSSRTARACSRARRRTS